MVLSNNIWIKWPELGLIGHAVLELTKTTHYAGTVGLLRSLRIEADSKLDGKPVDSCQSLEFDLTSSKGGKADLLTEVGEVLVCEHWGMPDELVDDIRFRSVFWGCMMADILRRVEYFEGKTVQKFSLRQKATDWLESPACFTVKIFRDRVKLWDGICAKTLNVLFHFGHYRVRLLACVGLK